MVKPMQAASKLKQKIDNNMSKVFLGRSHKFFLPGDIDSCHLIHQTILCNSIT